MIRYRCRCGRVANLTAEDIRRSYLCPRCGRKWKIPKRIRQRCRRCGKVTYDLRRRFAEQGFCDHCRQAPVSSETPPRVARETCSECGGHLPLGASRCPACRPGARPVASSAGWRPPVSDRRERKNLSRNRGRFLDIPLSKLRPNPFQPREHLEQNSEEFGRLCDSIRQFGVIVPILVRADRKGYTLIAGQRRLLACRQLNLETIPAVVQDVSFPDMLQTTYLENLHRRELTSIEKVQALERIQEECPNLSWEQLVEKFGLDSAQIEKERRLLELPMLLREAVGMRMISVDDALSLASITDRNELLRAIQEVHRRGPVEQPSLPEPVAAMVAEVAQECEDEAPQQEGLVYEDPGLPLERAVEAVERAVSGRAMQQAGEAMSGIEGLSGRAELRERSRAIAEEIVSRLPRRRAAEGDSEEPSDRERVPLDDIQRLIDLVQQDLPAGDLSANV